MNDALLVCRLERLGNLSRDGQGLVDGNRAVHDPLRQVFSLDEFHHEGRHAAAVFQAVDVCDVRVVQ